MDVFNQNAPFEVYRTFHHLVRKSKLCGEAGTITLSTDWATLDISATFRSLHQQAPPSYLARAKTPERLFALVFSSMATSTR